MRLALNKHSLVAWWLTHLWLPCACAHGLEVQAGHFNFCLLGFF